MGLVMFQTSHNQFLGFRGETIPQRGNLYQIDWTETPFGRNSSLLSQLKLWAISVASKFTAIHRKRRKAKFQLASLWRTWFRTMLVHTNSSRAFDPKFQKYWADSRLKFVKLMFQKHPDSLEACVRTIGIIWQKDKGGSLTVRIFFWGTKWKRDREQSKIDKGAAEAALKVSPSVNHHTSYTAQ